MYPQTYIFYVIYYYTLCYTMLVAYIKSSIPTQNKLIMLLINTCYMLF